MRHRLSAAVEGGPSNVSFTIEPLGGDRYRLVRGDRTIELQARRLEGPAGRATWLVLREGATHVCDVAIGATATSVEVGPHSLSLQLSTRPRAVETGRPRGATGPSEIKSPMPGKVVKILVNPGDAVTPGQGVVIVEAMKMENELRAVRGGAVANVLVKEGQAVEAGQVMLRLT